VVAFDQSASTGLNLGERKKSGTGDKKAATSSLGRTGGAEALQPTFLHLPQALTAENFLPADLVDADFKRMQDNLGSQLAALLARFEVLIKSGRNPVDIVRDDILPDTNLGPTLKTILLLWYTGGIKNAAGGRHRHTKLRASTRRGSLKSRP
jgi:hypothetical protein